jgi:hypothetical protein
LADDRAFSTGLAAVLVGLGLVLESRLGGRLRRVGDAGRLGQLIPLGSAAVVAG